MSLLCETQLYQLPVISGELLLNGDDIIWDNGVIEVNSVYEIGCILKFPTYGDRNNSSVFYLRTNLGSNVFVQTHISDIKIEL
jgi:hypothetical protein